MIGNYIYAIVGVLIVSLVSFAGVIFLSIKEETLKRYISIFISLAVGALLGGSFIHIIPEALENTNNNILTSSFIIIGILIFFLIEKTLHWHHHGEDKNEDSIHPVGKLILFSDGIHNFVDGVIIGVSFLVGIPVGIATTIAVILHEIPQEIGDFAVLINSGYKKTRALWLNFISALMAVVGVSVALIVGGSIESFVEFIMPIAAGGFIYIAVADLIPELHKSRNIKQTIAQVIVGAIGVLIMILLATLE